MGLPNFYAGNSLYRTGNNYVVVFDTGPQVRADLIPMGYKCHSTAWNACLIEVEWNYQIRSGLFTNCQGAGCEFILDQEINSCRTRFGCPASYACSRDAKYPGTDYCCPINKEACDGICLETCPPEKVRDVLTCGCKCAFQCRYPLVSDPNTCLCKCPTPCPPGFLQNPTNCSCYCPDGTTDCSGRCVVLGGDRYNCGSCGNVCAPNQDCCFGNCAPLNQNPNCGKCGNSCSTKGETCCASSGAAKGHCSRLNTNTDCGSCGNTCKNGKICINSSCQCPTGKIECGGVCIDPKTDRNNCGACGNVCPTGNACCNGLCKNIQTDTQNCGGCGKVCTGGKICSGGTCICPPGQIDCSGVCCPSGQQCCNGVCKNLMTDSQNCGVCGRQCTGGKSCVNGVCVCPTGQIDCNGTCCNQASCCNGTCCGTGFSCCNNSCVNTKTNTQHCGGCGKVCGPTSWCEGGGATCVPVTISCVNGTCICPAGWTKCSDTSCCPPQAPACTGVLHNTPYGPRYLCCNAGEVAGIGYYSSQVTCCKPQDSVLFTDGKRICY